LKASVQRSLSREEEETVDAQKRRHEGKNEIFIFLI